MIFSKKKTVTSKLNAHLPSVHPTNPLSKYHFVKIYYVKQMHICARCVCGREWLKKDPGGDIHTHILPLSSWPIPKKTSRIVSLTWIFFSTYHIAQTTVTFLPTDKRTTKTDMGHNHVKILSINYDGSVRG